MRDWGNQAGSSSIDTAAAGRGGSSVSSFKTTLFSKNVGEYIFPKLGNLDLDYQMGRGNSITYILTYLLVLHSTD